MADGPFQRLRQFLAELKRRNVYKVATTYAVVGFVLIQVANLTFVRLGLPSWTVTFVIVLVAMGFPLAVIVAWAFEMTPEGMRRTPEAEPAEEGAFEAGQGLSTGYKVLVGLGLIAAAVAGGWYLTGGGGESPEISEGTVAVFPFQVSGPGTESWREGMVTMLGTGLDGAAGLRAIADQTVLAAWERAGQGRGPLDTPRFLDAARRVGAQYAIVGSAAKLGGELQLSADVHETPSGDRLGQVEVRGSPDRITALTDSLTRRVLEVLLEKTGQEIPSVNLARLTTSSLPALKSYLAGERHFRAGEYEAAIEDYESAVAEDSTFALAYARLALSHGWLVEPAERFWKSAYRFLNGLPERERRLVRSKYLWSVQGRAFAAADSLRRLTNDYPDDPSVWYQLGELLFHHAIPRGWLEAEEAFGRAVKLDPGMAQYHHHYADLAFSLHHDSALAAQRVAAHPGAASHKNNLKLSLDLVFGPSERRKEILSGLLSGPDTVLGPFALLHPADRQLWVEVARRDLTPAARSVRPSIMSFAGAKLSAGQVRDVFRIAREESWSAEDVSCLLAHAISVGMPVPDSLAERYLTPDRVPEGASAKRLWCVGLSLIDRGEGTDLDGWLQRIRAAADTGNARFVPMRSRFTEKLPEAVLLKELRGYRAFRTGELSRAEELWSGLNLSGDWGAVWRGDLYRRRGELKTAEGWYLAGWPHPVAHERLGQLYEEMGKPEKAAAAYRRFIEAWKNADPELQDRVEAARKRLKKLTGSEAETDD